ncbi:hypothetical protein GCM10023322_51930 [Rugosimonospora acidiphila]|uniref:Beta/gamma crystallin 'Greek key' domain-containing protein n=1 Tax=Rugosimonospora acidiphila TaxID=556531 RepID=A0ABP9S874_9ACTN
MITRWRIGLIGLLAAVTALLGVAVPAHAAGTPLIDICDTPSYIPVCVELTGDTPDLAAIPGYTPGIFDNHVYQVRVMANDVHTTVYALVYDQPNYGGRCEEFAHNVWNLAGTYIGPNTASSIRFTTTPGGCGAQGEPADPTPRLTLEGVYNDTRLPVITHNNGDLRQIGFNDAAVYAIGANLAGRTVAFYADINYQGACFQYTFGSSLDGVPLPSTIQVSSIAFDLSCTTDPATMFGHRNLISVYGAQNEVLDVPAYSTSWGTNLQLYGAHNPSTDNQSLYIKPVGQTVPEVSANGVPYSVQLVKIMHAENRDWSNVTCLEVPGDRIGQPNLPVEQYGCDPNAVNQPNQLWAFVSLDYTVVDQWTSAWWDNYHIYNLALGTSPDSPVLMETSTLSARDGDALQMEPASAAIEPANENEFTLLDPYMPATPPPAQKPDCILYQCLLG